MSDSWAAWSRCQHKKVDLAVFVGIKAPFDALESEAIESTLEMVFDKYEALPPPDAITAGLCMLGIKSKATHIDAHSAGPDKGPDPLGVRAQATEGQPKTHPSLLL